MMYNQNKVTTSGNALGPTYPSYAWQASPTEVLSLPGGRVVSHCLISRTVPEDLQPAVVVLALAELLHDTR